MNLILQDNSPGKHRQLMERYVKMKMEIESMRVLVDVSKKSIATCEEILKCKQNNKPFSGDFQITETPRLMYACYNRNCDAVFDNMNDKTKQSLYNDMATVIQDILDTNQALNVMTIYRINRMLYKYNLQLDRPFCRIQLSLAVSGSVSNELSVNGETYVKHIEFSIYSKLFQSRLI